MRSFSLFIICYLSVIQLKAKILIQCLLLLTIHFSFFNSSFAQNLIPNPSFETYSSCPTINSSEVYLATPWVEVVQTSDYFNCSALDNNYIARTGTGYMGVSAYRPSWSSTYREFIGVMLTQSLTAGEKYYGEFWVRLAGNACWASDGMGMYISQGQPVAPSGSHTLFVNAQIMNTPFRMLDDREGWMKICGEFIANGGEDFITIGSFRDDSQSTFIELPGCPNQSYGVHWSYYHIDDVLLEQFDSTANYDCDDTTQYANPVEPDDHDDEQEITECEIEIPNVFSPNGDFINDKLETEFLYEKYTFEIINRWGKSVYFTSHLDNREHFWDGREFGKDVPDGVYYYILFSITDNCYKHGTITVLR